MKDFVVLVDIGSTFTKVTGVDLRQRRITAQSVRPQHPRT